MNTPLRNGFVYGKRLVATTYKTAKKHDCTDAAAAMAFDFVFAVFPALFILSAFIGAFGIAPEDFSRLLDDLGIVMPLAFIEIIEDNIEHLVDSSQSLLFIGIVGVIWSASASMSTTMTALNRALGLNEMRSFIERRILSFGLVLVFGISLFALTNLMVFSEQIDGLLRKNGHLALELPSLAMVLGKVAAVSGTLMGAALIYRYVPAEKQDWSTIAPGSVLFFVLWTCVVAFFQFYVQSFSYYSLVSGAFGVVIVILLSAYIVAFTLLLGGELNAAVLRLRSAK